MVQDFRAILPSAAAPLIDMLLQIPGLGVIVMVLTLLVTGIFATNIVGQWWLRQGDRDTEPRARRVAGGTDLFARGNR